MTTLAPPPALSVAAEGDAAAVVIGSLTGPAALSAVPLSPSVLSPSAAGGEEGKTKRGKSAGGGSKARSKAEAAERRKAEQISSEVARAQSLASARWSDCLQCLSSSLPLLQANPFLCILQPAFLYDYLDSLTETLANLTQHAEELSSVRTLLHAVYNSFIDLGRFAKYQPCFFIDDCGSLKRFIRLMEQVSHRQSDKALFPNILSLLDAHLQPQRAVPLAARAADAALPAQLRAQPVDALAAHLPHDLRHTGGDDAGGRRHAAGRGRREAAAAVAAAAAASAALSGGWLVRRALQAEPGWERLCKLCWGREPGLSKEQQQRGQQALQWAEADMPDDWKQGAGEEDDDDDDERAAGAADGAANSGDEPLTAVKTPAAAAASATAAISKDEVAAEQLSVGAAESS